MLLSCHVNHFFWGGGELIDFGVCLDNGWLGLRLGLRLHNLTFIFLLFSKISST